MDLFKFENETPRLYFQRFRNGNCYHVLSSMVARLKNEMQKVPPKLHFEVIVIGVGSMGAVTCYHLFPPIHGVTYSICFSISS